MLISLAQAQGFQTQPPPGGEAAFFQLSNMPVPNFYFPDNRPPSQAIGCFIAEQGKAVPRDRTNGISALLFPIGLTKEIRLHGPGKYFPILVAFFRKYCLFN